MNGFDDFDTKVTAEEFYNEWTEGDTDENDSHPRMRTILNLNESVTIPLQSNT